MLFRYKVEFAGTFTFVRDGIELDRLVAQGMETFEIPASGFKISVVELPSPTV